MLLLFLFCFVNSYFCLYVKILCGYVFVGAVLVEARKRVSVRWLDAGVTGCFEFWLLRTELRFSERATSALKH